jgi:hypothetical protein
MVDQIHVLILKEIRQIDMGVAILSKKTPINKIFLCTKGLSQQVSQLTSQKNWH